MEMGQITQCPLDENELHNAVLPAGTVPGGNFSTMFLC